MTAATAPLASVDAARRTLLAMVRPTAVEVLRPIDAAGMVLARPALADRSLPSCDVSAMDGYVGRAADMVVDAVLPIAGDARAGASKIGHVPGTAMPITTGGAVPEGADTVVPIEATARSGDKVRILVTATRGAYIRRSGQDVEAGGIMVATGRPLRPVDLAAAIAAGSQTLHVHRRPRVAILCGGDELVPHDAAPEPHQVIDSNGPMLAALVRDAGGIPLPSRLFSDRLDQLLTLLRSAAEEADLIVVSGGASVGDHDHVRSAVTALGEVLVWRVALRPGKPLLIGRIGDVPVVGLPGNPVSTAVTFEVFGRPVVAALQGNARPVSPAIGVRLGVDVDVPAGLETYVRVTLTRAAVADDDDHDDGIPVAVPTGGQDSAMLRNLAAADALAILRIGACTAAGTVVPALLLR